MHVVFWIIFLLVVIAGLFFYGRCQLLEDEIEKLDNKYGEEKAQIQSLVKKYRKNPIYTNACTTVNEISKIINKTALDSDQTD